MPLSDGPDGLSFAMSDIFGSGTPVAADRNPWLDTNAGLGPGDDIASNSACHQGKGQNVLYKDGSSRWERSPQVGIGADNIYTYGGDITQNIGDPDGTAPSGNGDIFAVPTCQNDALLVSEENIAP
jgi:hypothetical protein